MLYVIKKDGTREEFNPQKIVAAVNKSAERILYAFSDEEKDFICRFAQEHADSLGKNEIEIQEMHNIVEGALERVNPAVAKSYRDYRNYKLDFIHMMADVYTKSQAIRYIDKLDHYRESYYKYHTGRQWKRVENYDLCLDSAAIGLDNCVEVIKKVIELKFGVKCPQ